MTQGVFQGACTFSEILGCSLRTEVAVDVVVCKCAGLCLSPEFVPAVAHSAYTRTDLELGLSLDLRTFRISIFDRVHKG
jgi:hypothetical protein